jgi:crossover junction endodeoxyribonuclease RuvC
MKTADAEIVLGIDPGTRVVGWGVVVARGRGFEPLGAGVFKPNARLAVPERLAEIRGSLDALLAEFRPAIVVVEEAFAAHNLQSALRIGEGRGVALSSAAAFGARVVQYPPAVAKKTVVGHGGASKQQVARMVARLLGLTSPPEPLDATDALALALAHHLRASSPLAGARRIRIVDEALARRPRRRRE